MNLFLHSFYFLQVVCTTLLCDISNETTQTCVYEYTGNGEVAYDGRSRFTWDAFGRITSVTEDAPKQKRLENLTPTKVRYIYDALGRRIARHYSGATDHPYSAPWPDERIVYSGLRPVEERAIQEPGFSNPATLLRRYVYEPGYNVPCLVLENDAAYNLLYDDRGTILGVTDATTGELLEKLYYNTTGIITSHCPGGTPTLDDYGLPLRRSRYVRFGFTGMYHERLTGLYHTHFREYDPVHSIWLSRDPIAELGGMNLSAFCAADPVNFYDPLGLWPDWNQVGTRALGGLQMVGGVVEMTVGVGLVKAGVATSWAGVGIPVAVGGGLVVAHGADVTAAGFRTMWYGKQYDTFTSQGLQAAGMSQDAANIVDAGISIVGTAGAGLLTKALAKSAPKAIALAGQATKAQPVINNTATIQKTGQMHHVISRKVNTALSRHKTLQGVFNREASQFKIRAVNKEAHKGYQTWHRNYDNEMVNWLTEFKKATPQQFIDKLNRMHEVPDMVQRFGRVVF